MPKMKTRKAAAKRLKVTGTGKIVTRHAHIGHLRRRKSKRSMRHLQRVEAAAPADVKAMRRTVPYGA
ncbi:MAG: 50S ribosomal protein L35 [Armatimonadetes bacterium CG_4_10_14_3_um_filter_66_18]|nr:50S ribosomal protein L35 [Armatimonadota bacterium]OIP10748.1 MAG: 50S ribosomal protein L35 [Armatimonadetes bacterium CG2_30_66_41]PIU94817.1 MAG: 50S ribosomal protein L35 [Armatimonadetes bacterium CG06_land_8_20_14_3_00_66_21]PIW12880.1 MAG: 50S ribosomal protein L35 [Armatimonadetes bacterium CG17_big_fil_post_rev_8_21_14_2_50_66_6]PIX36763.1 MAG: 50S ribosomal protein L35 [Armatimonadetes bacterium CG_4_8_14_3_um_filter_66_20]PIY39147.1 MAG: 50S ribosomal protein L35 [Armatimonadete